MASNHEKCSRHRPIRLAIVGAGIAATSAHVPAIRSSQDCFLAGFCECNQERRRWAEKAWGVRGYGDIAAMLLDTAPDAVIIATPPDSHAELALACIEAGVHLLVEKPLAPSLVDAERIVNAARSRGIKLAVNYEKRFHPSLMRVRDLIAEGRIGSCYYAGVHWAATVKLDPEAFIPEGFGPGYRWRWRDKRVGGGIVQDHLPHYIDLLHFWTGSDPVAVFAHTFNVARDHLGWAPTESVWEDFGVVLTRFSNGMLLRVETGTTGRSMSPVWSLGSGQGEWTEYAYILGTRGQLLFDLLPWDSSENGRIALWELERSRSDRTGWTFVEQPEPRRRQGSPSGAAHVMFKAQLDEFIHFIRGAVTNIATGWDGILGLAAVEAAYRASRERHECNLPLHLTQRRGTGEQPIGDRGWR